MLCGLSTHVVEEAVDQRRPIAGSTGACSRGRAAEAGEGLIIENEARESRSLPVIGADDAVVEKLGFVDELWLEFGESAGKVHLPVIRGQNVDSIGDHVTHEYMLAHAVEAQAQRMFRALPEECGAFLEPSKSLVQVVDVLSRDVFSPVLH